MSSSTEQLLLKGNKLVRANRKKKEDTKKRYEERADTKEEKMWENTTLNITTEK